MITSSLTIVVNKAEIEKRTAISINSREYYYNKWKSLIEKKFGRYQILIQLVRLYNIRLAFHCTFVARLHYKIP